MREPLVTIDPEVMGGTPVFAGTRVPLKTLMAYLQAGDNNDIFLDHFPTVSREQVTRYLTLQPHTACFDALLATAIRES